MVLNMPEGKWVVAVSGGVDSVVLLDLLVRSFLKDQQASLNLIVAHFDHGIRDDSADDARFVAGLAEKYGLPFFTERVELGKEASEAVARRARYDFLRRVQTEKGADGIITAHHQDDLLETVILNMQRGTGSKGLSSLRSQRDLLRPLLGYSKAELLSYAKKHSLQWHEDSTNADLKYARNRVRHNVVSKLSDEQKEQLLGKSQKATKLNDEISDLVKQYLETQPSETELDRTRFVVLPGEVAREVLAQWLRALTDVEISREMILRLESAIRTGRNNSLADVSRGWSLHIKREEIQLKKKPTER